jgi:hypothetical protein
MRGDLQTRRQQPLVHQTLHLRAHGGACAWAECATGGALDAAVRAQKLRVPAAATAQEIVGPKLQHHRPVNARGILAFGAGVV